MGKYSILEKVESIVESIVESRKPEIPSCILSQYLWYNENIQVDKNSVYLVRFSEKNINYVSHLF